MDKNQTITGYNNCKSKHTAKVLYIQNYSEKRESLKNKGLDRVENPRGKTRSKVTYLDTDRQKTLDLFVKVIYRMKKESFQ